MNKVLMDVYTGPLSQIWVARYYRPEAEISALAAEELRLGNLVNLLGYPLLVHPEDITEFDKRPRPGDPENDPEERLLARMGEVQ